MLAPTRHLLACSPYVVFLKILRDTRVLSTQQHPDRKKPRWTSAACRHLYRNMNPETRADLERWALAAPTPKQSRHPDFAKRLAERRAALVARRERLLLQPTYVVSFCHFMHVNAGRFKRDNDNGSKKAAAAPSSSSLPASRDGFQKNRFRFFAMLWKKEHKDFKVRELGALKARAARAAAVFEAEAAADREARVAREAEASALKAAAPKKWQVAYRARLAARKVARKAVAAARAQKKAQTKDGNAPRPAANKKASAAARRARLNQKLPVVEKAVAAKTSPRSSPRRAGSRSPSPIRTKGSKKN